MAKLPRTTQKIFAKNAAAGQVTTFGSIKDGTPVYSTSAGDIMNSNFEDGWSAAVEDDYAPYRQDRNGVDTAVTQQLAYLFQEGIPEYDSGTVYYKGSICKVTDGTGVKIYKSIYDNHSAAVTNTSRWHLILNVDSSNNIVSPSITSPTISGGSMSNGTFANPTFSGTVNVPLASASSSTDSTIAASIGWANNPSLSSNIVHRTGNETIGGDKTFTGYIKGQAISNTNHAMKLGASGSDYMDFYEYGGLWNFYKSRNGTDTLIGKIAELTSSTDDETLATTNWVNNRGFALDSAVVKTSGNQTIAGVKTFSSEIHTTSVMVYKKTGVTKGTNPESTQYWQFFFADKNGSGDANSLGKIQTSVDSNGLVQTSMVAYKNTSGTSSERISIYYPTSGSAYTYAPTPATSDNSTKIATTAYVKAQGYALDNAVVKTSGDQNIAGVKTFSSTISGSIDGNAATVTNGVYTTGNQTVGGAKTFTSDITISKSNPTVISKNTAITKGTVPTSGDTPTNNNTYACVYRDSANKNIGAIMYQYATSKNVQTRIYAYKANASGDNADTYLRVYYTADGNYGVGLYSENASGETNESLTLDTTSTSQTLIPCMGWVNRALQQSGKGMATFSKSTNGYYKFTNGLIIQWGTTTTADNETTITLPTAFASTNYTVSCTVIANNAAYQRTLKDANSRTTTAFTTYMSGANGNSNFTWIAIGY